MSIVKALKSEFGSVVIIAAAAAVLFANSLWGDLVYDDVRQIAQNPLVQRSELYGKALMSDVWAFKGDGSQSASNYWRPTFTAWSIVNFKLFGVSPFGWHVTNLFLHIIAGMLAYFLMMQWAVPRAAAFWIALIFAVHPVHVESVAWISGSPDLLMAVFLFGSFLLLGSGKANGERISYPSIIGSAALFLLALGTKEVAIAALPVFAFLLFVKKRDEGFAFAAGNAAVTKFALFVLAGAAYFAGRIAVIGSFSKPVEDSAPLASVGYTFPAAVLFYLRQAIFPWWLSPNYPLRPVESFDVIGFAVPLLFLGAIVFAVWASLRSDRVGLLGVVLFGSLLAPALFISAFPREQIVHDRYLYVPLLGSLIAVWAVLNKLVGSKWTQYQTPATGLLVLYIGFLSVQTFLYNRSWLNDVSLWQRAVSVDPNSASNWLQLGSAIGSVAPNSSVLDAFDRSISIKKTPLALMGRGRSLIVAGRTDEAIRDLREVTSSPPENLNAYTLFQAYEALGLALQTAGRLPEAEKELRTARDRLPIYRASITEKIAVVLYVQGKKNEALSELESVRTAAANELIPAAALVYFRLGVMYAELGREQDAAGAFRQYLDRTVNYRDSETIAYRRIAADYISGRSRSQK